MADITKIEWTDATYNPWYACHKVSPGCANCYMDRWAKRSGRDPEKVTRAKDATFYAPLKWKEPKVIFTCSLSDFFIEEADPWRDDAWKVIADTPQHTYLILTKRPERIKPFLPGWLLIEKKWPWPHVRLGVSAENQYWLDKRLPELLKIPAAGYFVSAEPLLAPLDFGFDGMEEPPDDWHGKETERYFWHSRICQSYCDYACGGFWGSKLDAVIVGGESGGPKHRRLVRLKRDFGLPRWEPKPSALEWVRLIRDQCEKAGVKFILKQWGGPRPESGGKILNGKEDGGYTF